MLIQLKIKNFLSFKEETIFSMIANKDETLKNSLFKYKTFRLKKCAVIFGPNGSGKTNLVKIFKLMKFLVLNSNSFKKDNKFPENPFKLDSEFGEKTPIEILIKFLKNNNIYEYLVKVSTTKTGDYNFSILEEKLIKNEEILFEFNSEKIEGKFSKIISSKIKDKSSNKLIMPYVREENFDEFDEPYDWFKNNLEVFDEGLHYKNIDIPTELENPMIRDKVLKYLQKLSFSKIFKLRVDKKIVDEDKLSSIIKSFRGVPETVKTDILKKGLLEKSIFTSHKNNLEKKIEFNLIKEESLGTNQFIGLLIYIIKAQNQEKVLIIDEIERSLHPILLKEIFEIIQLNNNNTQTQLIATTHAYPLLLFVNSNEEDIFRRDQIYFTRLLKNESTQIYSLINIGGIRKDLNIFKAYFEGRLEAFPIFEKE